MTETSYYYLHTNGDLIYKRFEPEIEPGGFVRKVWQMDSRNRADAWSMVIEAAAMGASPRRVTELREKWDLTDDDAQVYADRLGFLSRQDGDKWMIAGGDFVNVQESLCGFGLTRFDAFVEFCKAVKGERLPDGEPMTACKECVKP